MKPVPAALRRHGLAVLAVIAVGILGVKHWSYTLASKHRERDAYDLGVKRGLEYACTALDPIAEEPFLIFDNLVISWESLVPNLAIVYGANQNPATPWTVPEVCGTFPVNGEKPPAGEVRTEGENLRFSKAGEYYLRTTVGDFKILILDRNGKRDEQAMAIAAFVSRNTVASMTDARKIQPNYSYADYSRPDKALRKFFASDQPLGFQCRYSAEFCNYVVHKRGFEVRKVWLRTGKDGAHFISEVFLPDLAKWVAVDSMYGVVFTDRSGGFLSVVEAAKLVHEHPEQVTVRDIAQKRWLKPPFGNFMHDFTWTPAILAEPCCNPNEYLAMIRRCTQQYWLMEYDRQFRCARVEKYAWNGTNLVR
jgi:hypothetical protein